VVSLSDGREVTARAVLITTGARYRRLVAPGVEELVGAGVSYTIQVYPTGWVSGRDVAVVGGGNAAGQAVLHLARYARRVLLVVRGDSLERQMSDYLVRPILAAKNVEVRLGTEVVAADGEEGLKRVTVRDRGGAQEDVEISFLLVLIGARPHSDWLAGAVECDAQGFVRTGDDVTAAIARRPSRLETSMPGVFAAGDVRHGSVKRVASAVGDGAVAVQLVHEYLASGEAAAASTAAERTMGSGASLG
jgi:thioredoxin reductase (NADPH)